MRLLVLSSILVIISVYTNAQNILTGQVLDSLTKKPIPFANVFFANTTIGTVTDTSGNFSLKSFPSGKYDLTVSFVGYNSYQKSVAFEDSHFIFKISLTQQVTQLSEIVVRADTAGWKRNYNLFKKLFIGETRNATEVNVSNPRDLRFYFDRPEQLLLGFGQKPIVIENKSLGYRIYYELMQFEFYSSSGRLGYFGIPRFEELKPKRNAEINRWARERERAYNGSSAHFIKSLKQNSLQENGFKVFYFYRVPNKKRPSDQFLSKRISYWLKKSGGQIVITSTSKTNADDSLGYYLRLRNEPKVVDSIGLAIKNSRELFLEGSNDIINYQGMLMVIYSEREEVGYAVGRAPANKQQSIVHFLGKQLKLYDNGYYENILDVFYEGYWSWSEKVSELLPLEYAPPKKVRN